MADFILKENISNAEANSCEQIIITVIDDEQIKVAEDDL